MQKRFLKNYARNFYLSLLAFGMETMSGAATAEAFNVGFNQGWINTSYEYQWSDKVYDADEVKRLLDLTKGANAKTIRMWLFEGVNSTALVWKDGKVASVNAEFLKNFEDFLREAKKRDIQVYPTFFAPEAVTKSSDQSIKNRWWNLFNNKYGGLEAFQEAINPVLAMMYSPEYRSSIFGIDLANEIDVALIKKYFENDWYGANKFICSLRNHIRSATPEGEEAIPVTASLGWPYIPLTSRGAENIILDPNPHPNCVDFWDIHVYDNGGEINNCEKIKELVNKHNKKIYLGEFGQFSKSYDDKLQLSTTENFIANAKRCGFSGALAWRLSDIRSGNNNEARYSYESFGKTRAAYQFVKNSNEQDALAWHLSAKKNQTGRQVASQKKKVQPKASKVPRKIKSQSRSNK
jgi:hypothetical protein